MDDAVHVLVEEVNSQGIPTYQEKIEGKSSMFQMKGKTEIIHNLTINPISEEKLFTIPKEIQEVINYHLKVISKGEWDIEYTDLVEYEIHLEYDCPIRKPVRYVNLRLANWLKKELDRMESIGVVRKLCSLYASPITIIKVKRPDRITKICLCSDVTDFNEATIKDAGLIPYQQIIFDCMENAKWFSNFDLVAEYWQVKIRKEDIHKTAFVTPQGQYEYLRMPFELYNASATF